MRKESLPLLNLIPLKPLATDLPLAFLVFPDRFLRGMDESKESVLKKDARSSFSE